MPPQPARHGFAVLLLIALGLFFLAWNLLPTLTGSRRAGLLAIVSNLRQVDIAKQMWASEHSATNGAQVTDEDLARYLGPHKGSTGLVASAFSEAYRPSTNLLSGTATFQMVESRSTK